MTKRLRRPELLNEAYARLEHIFSLEEAARYFHIEVDEAIDALIADDDEDTDAAARWAESLTPTNCDHIEYRLAQLFLARQVGDGREE